MILLTGGLGFIGLHTAAKLLNEGHRVLIVDNLSGSHLQMLERLEYVTDSYVTFVRQDIRNTPALQRIFEQYGVTAVAHFAGFNPTAEGMPPLELYNCNLGGLLSVLRVMSRTGVNTLLYGSSACVYADSSEPLFEDDDLEPVSAYARSFDMGEQVLLDIDDDKSWRIGIMRYFEVGGSHSSHLLGDWPRCVPEKLLPCMALVAQGMHDKVLLTAGADTPDGTVIRDYVHVDDVAEANMQALAYLHSQDAALDVFNVGTGIGHSQKQVCNVFEDISGLPITHEKIIEEGQALVDRRIANIEHTQNTLNWQPHKTLEDICEDTWRFFEKLNAS